MSLRLLLGLSLLAGAARADAPRPNVVLIVADDLGGADLGCYGSKFFKTPNLDKLAATGRRFTQSYSACPVCSPTRAALMTGKHPARLHLTDWLPGRPDRPDQPLLRPKIREELPLEEVTIAESLKAAGYTTAIMGKWHLGGKGFEPTKQGFDVNIGGDETGTPCSYKAPFGRNGQVMPGLEDAPDGQYLTDRLADEAAKFIEAHKEKPFFLYLPHYAVHTPMVAKDDLIAHYAKWDGTPHGRQENPIYAAMLESLDAAVGRVAKAIDDAGLTEKTLFLFTSDNGGLATKEGPNTPATYNAPFREGKGWLYEGGVRVPLLVRWPGVVAPGVESTPVWSADLPVTIKALCGVKDIAQADGVNLAELLKTGQPLPRRALYWHYPHYANQGGRPGAAIRDGEWKLIQFDENGRRELFKVGVDLAESQNVADKEPERVEQLAAKLEAWRNEVDAQRTSPNPAFVPNPQAADGVVTLPARNAEVHGAMLRYEPLPHKNTLGFWVRVDDWASWDFTLKTPGEYAVTALVGCGTGNGGSAVEFRLGDQVLKLTVPVTGGFQNFVAQDLGRVTLAEPGKLRLEVHATSKPKLAVMDLREVTLTPIKK